MKTMSLADARQNLSAVVSDVEAFDEHVLITKNGKPAAVIISADEWEEIEETAFWRSVPEIHEVIDGAASGQSVGLAEFIEHVRRRPA